MPWTKAELLKKLDDDLAKHLAERTDRTTREAMMTGMVNQPLTQTATDPDCFCDCGNTKSRGQFKCSSCHATHLATKARQDPDYRGSGTVMRSPWSDNTIHFDATWIEKEALAHQQKMAAIDAPTLDEAVERSMLDAVRKGLAQPDPEPGNYDYKRSINGLEAGKSDPYKCPECGGEKRSVMSSACLDCQLNKHRNYYSGSIADAMRKVAKQGMDIIVGSQRITERDYCADGIAVRDAIERVKPDCVHCGESFGRAFRITEDEGNAGYAIFLHPHKFFSPGALQCNHCGDMTDAHDWLEYKAEQRKKTKPRETYKNPQVTHDLGSSVLLRCGIRL